MLKEVIINENNTSLVESVVNEKNETEPIMRKRVIKTHTYMRNILSKAEQRCELFPRNCRMIQNNGPQTFFVIEQPPEVHPVRFQYDFHRELAKIKADGVIDYPSIQKLIKGSSTNVLRLMFPYTVFLISIRDDNADRWGPRLFKVFFRNHTIKRMNDYLFIANILNLSDVNNLCFGGGVSLPKTLSLSEAAEKLVNEFWIRPFIYEYESRYLMYKNVSVLNNFLLWAYYTQKDPMFIYSAKWILHERTLRQELDTMLMETDSSSSHTRFYSFFVDTVQATTGNNPQEISFDTLRLRDRILSVGDQLKYNGNDLFVYNFIGDRDGPKSVIFTDANGVEQEPVGITNTLKTDWNKQIEDQLTNYVDAIKLGEYEIRTGDIIKIVSTNSYEIVKRIRISRDSLVELDCNGKFYIAKEGNIKPVKSVDTNGVELNPNTEYIICDNQYQHGYAGKMSNIKNNGPNNLVVYFKDTTTNMENGIAINSLEEQDVLIFPREDDKIRNLTTFRYMNRLYSNNDDRYLIVKNCGVYDRRGNENEQFIHLFNPESILGDILKENNTELFIPGIDRDISFKVGDTVVIGDWNQPDDLMFNIREIVGFNVQDNRLFFNLKDSNNSIINVEYINFSTGVINVGYIRKAVREYNNIPVGTIIVANQAGIFNFPKKDRNKIVAFITDTATEPLVLFKSGLTMWFGDIENRFDLLLPGTPEFKKIRKIRTLDLNTIDWQSGDLCVNENNEHYLMNNDNPYMGIVYMQIHSDFVKSGSLRSRARVSAAIDESFKRYGIIDPRYAKKDSVVEYENIPDFHNGYYKTTTDGYYPYTIRRIND